MKEDMIQLIRRRLDESIQIKHAFAESQTESIAQAAEIMIASLKSGGKILLCGNGGSAADSQHIAAELVVRFQKNRAGLAAIALTTDTSILTAAGNDVGFEAIFSRQVEALGRPGDVLVGISTSGCSSNVAAAMKSARGFGLKTIAWVGSSDGPVTENADCAIRVPSDVTARIQECHITAGHILCELIEKTLFP
jgi:D-sedoheptulose 7-phosphate isomerase